LVLAVLEVLVIPTIQTLVLVETVATAEYSVVVQN
jgi:hypothetical protein